ncbi:PLP-dependent transferase [Epithele typhae]|uniref:PLP-dependent transferase n=1 Tax=Epithele typhae TaxID=378194 RepID=UPI00200839E2|nr:PLP-dependent transferase [Epithele typhae]KAH9942392.1 PLP-dependent transferase [Epithele typhae]
MLPVVSCADTTASHWQNFTNAVVVYLLLSRTLKISRHLRARGIVRTVRDFYKWVLQEAILLALRFPSAKKQVDEKLGKARLDVEAKMVPQGPGITRYLSLPAQGHDKDWILAEMARMDTLVATHTDWHDGKVSGAVYHGGEDLQKVLVAAFDRYCLSNPLHPDVFPSVRKMEAEVVAMSIIMAVKTYRDWARATKGITEPEMIVPVSAHAAFDKGADYMGIKVHTIPIDPDTRQVDLKKVRRAINSNTIMLVGSAVNFPDGCQDDIVALAKLAHKHKIGMHVDCCLGSFIMPFVKEAGFPVRPFDFSVQGVTSISCDTHKYGFAPKGNSVIMYRDAELRRFQYYVNPDWMGGVYASPSIAGSRPGALIAGTWAAMQYMGHSGYLESCKSIVGAAKTIAQRIRSEIPELRILGDPPASLVAFAAAKGVTSFNVHEVGDMMSKKGWHLNALSNPAGLHIACTRLTVPMVDNLIADLKDAISEAKLSPSGEGTMVTVYGLGESSPVGYTMVGHVATAFLDTLYKA